MNLRQVDTRQLVQRRTRFEVHGMGLHGLVSSLGHGFNRPRFVGIQFSQRKLNLDIAFPESPLVEVVQRQCPRQLEDQFGLVVADQRRARPPGEPGRLRCKVRLT